MRNQRAVPYCVILIAIGMVVWGSALVLGQGGTGKGSNPRGLPPVRKTVPPKRNIPVERPTPSIANSCGAQSPTKATGRTQIVDLSGGVSMELVELPAGSFCMGSHGHDDEKPVHLVRFNRPFYIGRFEVTQAQWQAVMGDNPSHFKDCGGNCPVEFVSRDAVGEFLVDLNARVKNFTFRLPSEAEWEYAARAGASTTYPWGEDPTRACQYGNVADLTGKARYPVWATFVDCTDGYANVAPVGSFQPNNFGLYDMIGNVSEWCADRLHSDHVGAPSDGSARGENFLRYEGIPIVAGLVRGAAWGPDQRGESDPRSSIRSGLSGSSRGNFIGFRVVAVRKN